LGEQYGEEKKEKKKIKKSEFDYLFVFL